MEYELLKKIKSPNDLKKLNYEELKRLCAQLRLYIVDCVAENGGHLASNLGTVELTVALHRVINAPKDVLIFDVGHQSYAHKILTGRMEQMLRLRREDGVSGFAKRYESEYDAFGCGHSSTSVSAALGFAAAARLSGKDSCAVAVIGDGALTGGLAYEGLNNAGRSGERIVIVLNDNDISISNNVGAIARYLHKITLSGFYYESKQLFKKFLSRIPLIGKGLYNFFSRTKKSVKKFFFNGNFFEDLGFVYFGPVDGHDVPEMERLLKRAIELRRPAVVHVKTIKGCGYKPAEDEPSLYHGVSPFEQNCGVSKGKKACFSEVFGEELVSLAAGNRQICAITAAMTDGVGLNGFAKAYPERFFDVGIAEGHAVTFASGLSAAGYTPVFACYSTFLQRAYDQILHDAAIQKLRLILAVDRAGFVGDDGETHQGLFDVSFLLPIPGVHIYSPFSYIQLQYALSMAVKLDGITAIRYPRGAECAFEGEEELKTYTDDFISVDVEDAEVLILTYGRIATEALRARLSLRREGFRVGVISFFKLFPVNIKKLLTKFEHASEVFFFEEGMKAGGLGEYVGMELIENGYRGAYRSVGAEDFISQASPERQIETVGLDARSMTETIKKTVKGESA